MDDYEYEEDLDILYISNNPSKEKAISNFVLGNFVIDIGDGGKVLGIEVDCASKFFNFLPDQIKHLKFAKIKVIKIGNFLTLGIIMATQLKEYSFQFTIPNQNQISKIPIVSC